MDRDVPESMGPVQAPASIGNSNVLAAAAIGTVTVLCVGLFGLLAGIFQAGARNGYAQEFVTPVQPADADVLTKLKFPAWSRPDVAILLSGEQHGYLQPCGCSEPQYGGLARRYNLIQAMRQRGWPVVAADLGDINQIAGPSGLGNAQGMLKYEYAMKALDKMGYTAVNLGVYEMTMSLAALLPMYAMNTPTPRVVTANLLNREAGEPFNGMNIEDWELAGKHAGPKVGVFGLTALSVEKRQKATINDPLIKFNPNTVLILAKSLAAMRKQGAELIVLLYQGNKQEAKLLAQHVHNEHAKNPQYPLIDVILCLSDDPEPPATPTIVPNNAVQNSTMIVEVGHKGKYVGVVGAFGTNGKAPFRLQYHLVSVAPELNTPKGLEASNPIMNLMEEYTAELKDGGYLAKHKQGNHALQLQFPGSTYIGSKKCASCHEDAAAIWQNTPHSHAYKTLVDAKHPSSRQFDAECVVCHTVGFGYKSGFENETLSAKLLDVGCESCHGPGGDHYKNPKNAAIHEAMNPNKWRGKVPPTAAEEQKRLLKIDIACQKCHDQENDVHFNFAASWPKVIHMTPKAGGNPPPQVKGPPK